MKVICINDKNNLTYGKAYKVIEQLSITITPLARDHYRIIDNNGTLVWYDNEVVIPMDEWRNKQLNELGILDIVEIPQKSGI